MMASILTYLANAAWQVTLIASLAAMCGWMFRTAPARNRHQLYVGALVAGVLTPLGGLANTAVAPLARLVQSATGHPLPVASDLPATRSMTLTPQVATVCLVLAGLLFAWRLVRLARAAWSTRGISRAPYPTLEGGAATIAARAAQVLGVHRYRVVASTAVSGPITFGLLHPTIVVPSALAESSAADLLASAVGHELAHVRRHDFLWNLLLELIVAPLAFHPGAWFLKRRVDETRELACDELVAEQLVERRVYARCLVRLASAAVAAGSHGYAMGAVAPPLLDERVRRLIDSPGSKRRLPLAVAAAVLALATVTSARWTVAFSLAGPPMMVAPIAVDWLMEGISACAVGDAVGADEAYSHLIEVDRTALAAQCADDGLGHCSNGFAKHDR